MPTLWPSGPEFVFRREVCWYFVETSDHYLRFIVADRGDTPAASRTEASAGIRACDTRNLLDGIAGPYCKRSESRAAGLAGSLYSGKCRPAAARRLRERSRRGKYSYQFEFARSLFSHWGPPVRSTALRDKRSPVSWPERSRFGVPLYSDSPNRSYGVHSGVRQLPLRRPA